MATRISSFASASGSSVPTGPGAARRSGAISCAPNHLAAECLQKIDHHFQNGVVAAPPQCPEHEWQPGEKAERGANLPPIGRRLTEPERTTREIA